MLGGCQEDGHWGVLISLKELWAELKAKGIKAAWGPAISAYK